MTASGFRAFFPPNGGPPPAPPGAHLQHILPSMRFLAQKLENPNFFSNFPPHLGLMQQQQQSSQQEQSLGGGGSGVGEEDGDEVTTSNLGPHHFPSESTQNNSLDHGNDSGKPGARWEILTILGS